MVLVNERLYYLKKLKQEIELNRAQILVALNKDLGKCQTEAYITEYYLTVRELEHTIKHLAKWTRIKNVREQLINIPCSSYIIRKPYGKVSIAAPWNYPFYLSMIPIIGAISGGNTVLLKVSQKTKNTAKLIYSIIEKVFPKEKVEVIGLADGDREKFMKADTDFIFFTGSLEVGKKIAKLAAEKLIPYVLELGGKSPAIITENANLDTAVRRLILGKLVNVGQTCIAPDYLILHESLVEEFFEKANKTIADFYGGEPLTSPDYGQIIDVEKMKKFKNMCIEAGIYKEDNFDFENRRIRPHIFLADLENVFMQEEIFGPFLPVLTYKEESEILAIVKKNNYPLALYVFTENKEEESFLIESIDFGGATINDSLLHITNPNLPFGGIKTSGMGRYHGEHSFKCFTYEAAVLKKSIFPDFKIKYPPYKLNIINFLKK